MFDCCDSCAASVYCAKRGRRIDPYSDACDECIMELVEDERNEYRIAWMKYIYDFENIYA